MKQSLLKLLEQLRSASTTTQLAIAGTVLLMLAVGGYAAFEARNPHFILLYSQLDEAASARVQAALAADGIRFKVSQPPSPYFIHVDSGSEFKARNAVALAGALTPEEYGIQAASGGMDDVFQDADTRRQRAKKLEWQEMEKQLEVLDFVQDATVTTSSARRSPFRREEPVTVSVTLTLRGVSELSDRQTSTVAKLVRNRFGVPDENVMISDQRGYVLFDGSERAREDRLTSGDLLVHKLRYEEETARRVNRILARVLGDGRGEVLINSQWKFDVRETVTERLDPENKVVVSERSDKTKTPQASGPSGGVAGLDVGMAGTAPVAAGTNPAPQSGTSSVATTEELDRKTVVGSSTEYTQSRAPVLERISVALFTDDSAPGDLEKLVASIKESVGFDETRGDTFQSFSAPFASIERDEEGKPVEPAPVEAPPAPNPMLELLLERGVEVAAALVFLVLLVRTLRGSRKARKDAVLEPGQAAKGPEGSPAAEPGAELTPPDPELLAREQVAELLASDPQRVGEVLSRWATEAPEPQAANAGD